MRGTTAAAMMVLVRSTVGITASLCLALTLSACLGNDDDGAEQDRAQLYALAVERVTDRISEQSTEAVAALNRLRDGSVAARPTASLLERAANEIDAAEEGLAKLRPPGPVDASANDLEFSVNDLALHLRIAASDVRGAARGFQDPLTVARDQSRIVLAYQSGISALGRAIRSLAIESSR